MAKIHVTAKRDFLEGLTHSKPLLAIAELVWNGFDAQASKVQVYLDLNKMHGIQAIRVRDTGAGMNHDEIETLFGSLGESWKKKKARINGRALHGKNGKGRFKAFALGSVVEWVTTFRKGDHNYTFRVTGNTSTLEDFDITEPVLDDKAQTGTEVTISNIRQEFRSLLDDSVNHELGKIFAAYLTEYPVLVLEFNGLVVDARASQSHSEEYEVPGLPMSDGTHAKVVIRVVEWSIPTERVLHLCDSSGIALHEVQVGPYVKAPGFNFTAYVKTDYFRELDKQNLLMVEDLHTDTAAILKVARHKIRDHFRRRMAEDQGQIIQRWKEERIYPYEDSITLNPVEEAERQVFDILAVNVQSYLPSFEDADTTSKRFTFRLLAQAVRENPESVQQIIGEVLGLKKADQEDLAELLKKTPLSAIISSAKIVANRLDFLMGLEALLFEKETKAIFLERDQLHKVLEKEAWLFHEEFALAGSEQRLETVLEQHLAKLGKRSDDDASVDLGDGKTGRIDLMLHKVTQPRTGQFDYLVVELKRPSQRIDEDVINQVKKYAVAVARDERFQGVTARWTFVAVSNSMNEFAMRDANQRGRPRGQVFDDAELNITVWVRTWAEVLNDARARLRFVNEHLAYEADRDSAKNYLRKTHDKYIPVVEADTGDQPGEDVPSSINSDPKEE